MGAHLRSLIAEQPEVGGHGLHRYAAVAHVPDDLDMLGPDLDGGVQPEAPHLVRSGPRLPLSKPVGQALNFQELDAGVVQDAANSSSAMQGNIRGQIIA